MISVAIDDIQEGMILAEDVAHNASVIITRETVLKLSHIERLKKFQITDVLVRDIEGEQIADQKIKSAHKSMARDSEKKMFRKGKFVCIQGESSEELYILVDGQLNVILLTPNSLSQVWIL